MILKSNRAASSGEQKAGSSPAGRLSENNHTKGGQTMNTPIINDAICAICDLISTACEQGASDEEINLLSRVLDDLLPEAM